MSKIVQCSHYQIAIYQSINLCFHFVLKIILLIFIQFLTDCLVTDKEREFQCSKNCVLNVLESLIHLNSNSFIEKSGNAQTF